MADNTSNPGVDSTALKVKHNQMSWETIAFPDLIHDIPFPVAMFDLEIKFMTASAPWIRGGKLTGKKWQGERFGEVCEHCDEWEQKHLLSQQGAFLEGREEQVRLPFYETIQYVNWQIRPWRKVNGAVGGTVMSIQNVTESVFARQKLQKSLEYEEEIKKVKSEFLSNISHELRTPLNGILGFTGLAIDAQTDNQRLQYMEIVRGSSVKLLNIIDSMLDFSRLESGAINLEIQKIPLCELVRQTVDVTSEAIHAKGLEMLVRFHDQHPLWIQVDARRLRQVLGILLDNARKFTSQGEIELSVRQIDFNQEQGIGRLRFSVRDTGIGIGEFEVGKIMQAFTQAESPATKQYEGTGLGLAIATNLLEKMNSQLDVVSTPGSGSTFSFDLAIGMHVPEVNSPIRLDFVSRVLIVDDNQSARRHIEEILNYHDITCDHAQNKAEALALIGSKAIYDAVILEHDLPKIDGLSIAGKLKSLTRYPAPAIILTHSSLDQDALREGIDRLSVKSLLQKPVRYQDLISAMSSLFNGMKKKDLVDGLDGTPNDNAGSDSAISILMVEDNRVNMLLLRSVLQKLLPGAELIEAGNGLVALNICRQKLPDLIFMDVQMPVMNGLDATKAIRLIENADQLPIIALTAGNEMGAREKCLNAGMNEFLTKPYTSKDIMRVCQSYNIIGDSL